MSTDLNNIKNDKKFIKKAFWHLMFAISQNFTMERMMGCSMTMLMLAVGEDLYPGDIEKQKELAKNHCVFFNTQQGIGNIVWGVTLGMEVERAKGAAVPNDMIQTVKTALAGPFAGIGDTIMQTLIIPIIMSIAVGMSSSGSPIGPIFAIIMYLIINGAITWFMFNTGFRLGIDGADALISSGVKDRIVSCIEILGVIVVGGVMAGLANVQTGLQITTAELSIAFQTDIFDAIYPGLLTLICGFIVYWLIKVKKLTATKIMLGMIVVSVIGYFTHILA